MTTKTDTVPFMAVGNNELGDPLGDAVRCPHCNDSHPLEYGTTRTLQDDGTLSEPVESKFLAFYKCGDQAYLAGVGGKYLPGMEEA